MNPVARRELQERFRTLRSPVLLSLWVLAAGVLTFLAYLTARSSVEGTLEGFGFAGLGSIVAGSSMGRFILHALLLGLLTAMIFVIPGQAAVSIVGERERQTLPLLQASQLSAFRIVLGKLLSSLAYVLLLLVASTPLLVIPVLLGGVTLWQVLGGIGMVAAAAIMIGAVSMWVSARAKSTQGAVLGAYVWTIAIVFGSFALLVAEVILAAPDDLGRTRFEAGIPRDEGRELYASWFNPYLGLVDISSDTLVFRQDIVDSPYTPFRSVLVKRQGFAAGDVDSLYSTSFFGRDTAFAGDFRRGIPVVQIPNQETRRAEPIRSALWWRTLAFEGLVTGVALLAAARLVKVPRRRIRLPRRTETADAAA